MYTNIRKMKKLLTAFMIALIILFVAGLPLIFLYALSVDEVLILLAYIPHIALFVLFLLYISAKKKFYNEYEKINSALDEALKQ